MFIHAQTERNKIDEDLEPDTELNENIENTILKSAQSQLDSISKIHAEKEVDHCSIRNIESGPDVQYFSFGGVVKISTEVDASKVVKLCRIGFCHIKSY